ncbi:Methyltransferase like 9 [Fasciola gigantica]|uniref:Methyltransferase like 9 n=1 Tax=Fasciola gigantica TaxID=46835 RepID=A0A504Z3B1_FASGI|nr:Methyltransferase like 9 [Fasciola gigantica]
MFIDMRLRSHLTSYRFQSSDNEDSLPDYIRSPLVRTLHNKFEHQKRHSLSSHDEWYVVRPDYFTPEVMQKFQQSHQDAETEKFLENCFRKSDWIFTHFYHAIAKAVLTWFMTSTSINGLLRRGSMFVVSSKQIASLLSIEAGFQYDSLLDLGAGDGMVTRHMAVFFRHVYATELSRPMRWRLQEHGFTVLDADTWTLNTPSEATGSNNNMVPTQFDVISCLNLLDRCDAPLTMLRRIAKALKPKSGLLIVGIVLPLKQYVESEFPSAFLLKTPCFR